MFLSLRVCVGVLGFMGFRGYCLFCMQDLEWLACAVGIWRVFTAEVEVEG